MNTANVNKQYLLDEGELFAVAVDYLNDLKQDDAVLASRMRVMITDDADAYDAAMDATRDAFVFSSLAGVMIDDESFEEVLEGCAEISDPFFVKMRTDIFNNSIKIISETLNDPASLAQIAKRAEIARTNFLR